MRACRPHLHLAPLRPPGLESGHPARATSSCGLQGLSRDAGRSATTSISGGKCPGFTPPAVGPEVPQRKTRASPKGQPSHAFPKVTHVDPGELRSCRKVAQQCSNNCSGNRGSAQTGGKSANWAKCWPVLARGVPNLATLDQHLSFLLAQCFRWWQRLGQVRPTLTEVAQSSVKLGRRRTNFGPNWPVLVELRQSWTHLANIRKEFAKFKRVREESRPRRKQRVRQRLGNIPASVGRLRSSPGSPWVISGNVWRTSVGQLSCNYYVCHARPLRGASSERRAAPNNDVARLCAHVVVASDVVHRSNVKLAGRRPILLSRASSRETLSACKARTIRHHRGRRWCNFTTYPSCSLAHHYSWGERQRRQGMSTDAPKSCHTHFNIVGNDSHTSAGNILLKLAKLGQDQCWPNCWGNTSSFGAIGKIISMLGGTQPGQS